MLETIVLQVTTKCPYRCKQCYMKRGEQDMSLEGAKRAIDEAVELGAKAVQITGGEPLMHPRLMEIIAYVSNVGLSSLLATSGYNCSSETYSRLKASGLMALCVSLNGLSEYVNEKSRIPFGEALFAIRMAQAHNLLCFLNTVVTDDNIDELISLGDYGKANGVFGVNILRPVPSYDGSYVPHISTMTLKRIAETVNEAPDFFHVEGCYKEYWEYVNGNRFSCRDIGKKMYFVNVDGRSSPCSKMTRYKFNTLAQMLSCNHDWKEGCV